MNLKRFKKLKNPHVNILLKDIRRLKRQNQQLRRGVKITTPLYQQPVPRHRIEAVTSLVYTRDEQLCAAARTLAQELDRLERENRWLADAQNDLLTLS